MAANTLKIDVHTPAGKKDGSVELPAELFDVEPNIALMHQVVEAQRAAARQRLLDPQRAAQPLDVGPRVRARGAIALGLPRGGPVEGNRGQIRHLQPPFVRP